MQRLFPLKCLLAQEFIRQPIIVRRFCIYTSSRLLLFAPNHYKSVQNNDHDRRQYHQFLTSRTPTEPGPAVQITKLFSRQISTKRTNRLLGNDPKSQLQFLTPTQKFEELIGTLGSEIRRKKRINRRTILAIVEMLKRSNSNLSEEQEQIEAQVICENGPFLLGCTTSLLPQMSPEERSDVATTIWKSLEKSSSSRPQNLDLLNTLLRSYVYNEHRNFDPTEFLIPALGAAGAGMPNSKTFYYILLAYCQRGDLENARKILEILHEKSIPVTENHFNALILGNGRAGDWDGAKKIIELMENAGVFPSTKTYITLLQVFVENTEKYNDKEFQELYRRAATEVRFSDMDFLTLAKRSLAAKNYPAFYKILDWIFDANSSSSSSSSFAVDDNQIYIFNSIISIIWAGFPKDAFRLFSKWIAKDPSAEKNYSAGFIKEIINAKMDFPTVEYIYKNFKNPISALLSSAEYSLKSSQFSLSIALFQKMKEQKLPIRPHYFWPIFASAQNSRETLNTIDQMKSLEVLPDVDSLLDYIIPKLYMEHSAKETLELINQSSGLSLSADLLKAMLLFLLRIRKLSEAANICQNFRGTLSHPNNVVELLFQNLNLDNLQLALPILKAVYYDKPSEDRADYVGKFLIKLTEYANPGSDEGNVSILQNFLDGLRNEKIPISTEALSLLSSKVSTNLLQLVNISTDSKLQLGNGNWNSNNGTSNSAYVHPKEMDLQSLESHLIELKSKGLNTRGALRKLFIKYCQIHRRLGSNPEPILRLKYQFEKEFGEISVGMKSSLLGVWIERENFEEAKKIYGELNQFVANADGKNDGEESLKLDAFKIIDFVSLLAKKSGDSEEAFSILQNDIKSRVARLPELKESISRNVVRLLENFASNDLQNGTNFTKVALDWLLQEELAAPTNPILGVLIKHYLEQNDLPTSLKTFTSFAQKYKVTPASAQLGYAFVGSEDPELLNSFIEANSAAVGKNNTLHSLAFIYSDLGELDKSQEIFNKLGKSINPSKLEKQIEYLTRRNERDKILNLIKVLTNNKIRTIINNEELLNKILRIPIVHHKSLEVEIQEIINTMGEDVDRKNNSRNRSDNEYETKIPGHLRRQLIKLGKLAEESTRERDEHKKEL